jgi:hypothetical protein
MPQRYASNIGTLLGNGADVRAYGRYEFGAGDSH